MDGCTFFTSAVKNIKTASGIFSNPENKQLQDGRLTLMFDSFVRLTDPQRLRGVPGSQLI